MTRSRASVEGGYTRRTISIPAELYERIQEHLQEQPGLTFSAFMTEAGEAKIDRIEKRRK